MSRRHQIYTQARLQFADNAVFEFREEHGRLPTDSEFAGLLDEEHAHDAWGQRLHYATFENAGAAHYVLASTGKDRQLDLPRLEDYVGTVVTQVDYNFASDIVVVDGTFVRNAGK